jgi:outer membrane protein assembly factor BamB
LENGIVNFAKTSLPALALLLALGTLEGGLVAQAGKASSVSSDWYQYRGPKRDGISLDTGLLKQWPAGGPALAWKATGLGEGFSSVAVAGNRIYTMGSNKGAACIVALNAADGKMVWMAPVGDKGGNNGAGPRSTPATDGALVYGLGQEGSLVCVQAATGREGWRKNMRDYGGEMMSGWGYSESPLIDGQMLVVTPGGNKGTVAALNKMNGAPVWQSAQLKDKAPYSSLVPAEIGKVPQYIVFTENSVAGIAAKNGQVLWKGDCAGKTAIASSPVHKDGYVFVSSGYGVGCHGFQVSAAGAQFKAQQLYADNKIQNHHGGSVLVGDHVYALFDGGLMCVELKTGKVAWQNGSVGKGSITCADGMLFCRSERGPVALVEASPESYKEKGRFDQPDRSKLESWANPVVFGGKLYLRDQDVLLCYDVKGK